MVHHCTLCLDDLNIFISSHILYLLTTISLLPYSFTSNFS